MCRSLAGTPCWWRPERARASNGVFPPQTKKARSKSRFTSAHANNLVVVFLAEVRDQFLAHHQAQRIFQLHRLNEEIVLGIHSRAGHWRFEIIAQPFLDAAEACALRQVHEHNE